jgi:hypothetical protein
LLFTSILKKKLGFLSRVLQPSVFGVGRLVTSSHGQEAAVVVEVLVRKMMITAKGIENSSLKSG